MTKTLFLFWTVIIISGCRVANNTPSENQSTDTVDLTPSVCAENLRQCNGNIIQLCTGGNWLDFHDCASTGEKCVIQQGTAICQSISVANETPTTAGTEERSETENDDTEPDATSGPQDDISRKTDSVPPRDTVSNTGETDTFTPTGSSDAEDSDSTTESPNTDPDSDTSTDVSTDTQTSDTSSSIDPCNDCVYYEGVDIIAVVDNSISMEAEQQILATSFYTLVNAVTTAADWGNKNVRLGIVNSDLGYQYGDFGDVAAPSIEQPECSGDGDRGTFMTTTPDYVQIQSEIIRCLDISDCPQGLTCEDDTCSAPGGDSSAEIECSALTNALWIDHSEHSEASYFANQGACLSQVGTEGCGIEQQLQSAVWGLSRDDQPGFIRDNHLLAVIIVSDEEDCSIRDGEIWETDEWANAETRNVFCHIPESNEDDYLYDTRHFYDRFVELKGGQAHAVVFAAIVGVPTGEDSPCQGAGNALDGCLDDNRMLYANGTFMTADGLEYHHFEPACQRNEGSVIVTDARPGRRYVKVAQEFGCNGYVYSICNADWEPAMTEIARLITKCF